MVSRKEIQNTVIPIKEGWFHIPESDDDQPYLIGSKCENCGFTTFPKAMQGPPGFTTPYIQAFVNLDEGVRIFTLIEGCKPEDDALQLGQEMELVIGKIKEDEQGNDIIGWKFKPVVKQ
jgi:uncharacterized OB-fold protein